MWTERTSNESFRLAFETRNVLDTHKIYGLVESALIRRQHVMILCTSVFATSETQVSVHDHHESEFYVVFFLKPRREHKSKTLKSSVALFTLYRYFITNKSGSLRRVNCLELHFKKRNGADNSTEELFHNTQPDCGSTSPYNSVVPVLISC